MTFCTKRRISLALLSLCAALSLRIPLVAEKRVSEAAPAVHQAMKEPATRYLYVLDGGAGLNKLDTVTGKRILTLSLDKRTDLIPTRGIFADSAVDGCSTCGAVYLASENLMYTLSPTTGSYEEDDHQHFRLLSFRLPDFKFVNAVLLPDPASETLLRVNRTGSVEIALDQHSYLLSGKRVIAASDEGDNVLRILSSTSTAQPNMPPALDLTKYAAPGLAPYSDHALNKTLTYEAIERSGDAVLVRLLGPQGEAFAIIHTDSMRVTLLGHAIATTLKDVHLAPGGSAVLVREAFGKGGAVPFSKTTGRLQLFDTTDGKLLRDWTNLRTADKFFLTITPNGKLAFWSRKEGYQVVPGFGSYPSQEVHSFPDKSPSFFYANR